ncbi:MAG TPA: MBL fold metallo-hydrolase [Stenotrophobium sp.]|nr:MBL fold metallo-hydrolase [Stenotrophobium sp.]
MDESSQRVNGRYRNRYSSSAHGPSMDLLKFLIEMRRGARHKPDLPQASPDVDWLKANRSVDALTWIGHSSFLVQWQGLNILTDPHLTARASPLRHAGPKRQQPPALDFAGLPKIDAVVVSHNHYDHLDRDTVKRLARDHAPRFFVPLGLKVWFGREGIDNVTELDWWQDTQWQALRVTAVPVQHFSGRTASDRNATLWCGFVLELAGRRLFFAGDTGYSRDFADIGERFAPIDLALIPIGAYEPRSFMRPVHVDPEEAVKIHRDIGSRQSVAMHWGTFRLTLEPLDDPPRRLAAALQHEGIAQDRFWVLKHGETRRF